MTKGYIYVSIQQNKNLSKRFFGFKYVDPVISKSYIYTQEINPKTDLLLCYLECINTVLTSYIEIVSKKQWIKYDNLKIAIDKRYKTLSKKIDVNNLINPSNKLEVALLSALTRYTELIKVIGNVGIIYRKDNNYLDLIGAILLKMNGGSNG